jgi:ribosomal protein S4
MPVADRFITALQLKLDGLAMTLGFAPNRLFAQELVKSGGLRINGIVITNCNFLLSVNDIIQIDLTLKEDISQLFRISKLNPTKSRILFLPYFQVS